MSLSHPPTPWETPEQDPIYEQLADVRKWFAGSSVPRSRRPTVGGLSKMYRNHWATFMSYERREIYEHILKTWVQLLDQGKLDDAQWESVGLQSMSRQVGKTQEQPDKHRPRPQGTTERQLERLQAAVHVVAIAFYPHDEAARRSWEYNFIAEGRVTLVKLLRLGAVKFRYVLAELEATPAKLAARRQACESSGFPATRALPTADDLILYAHDALQPASSRFARFCTFIGALVVVYKTAAATRAHDRHAVARLEAVRGSLEIKQQADAFAALPLEFQVSAVVHVRELLFDACKRVQTRRDLIISERMVKLLESAFAGHQRAVAAPAGLVSTHAHPFADEAYRNELLGAFAGGEHAQPSRSQAPRSLGKEASSRFFPAARTGSW
ncbi:hypothetical protein JCM9279_004019 [Rhodotorula babjevae]